METALENKNEAEYPLLGDRVQSTFIDTILIVIMLFIIASVLDRYENTPVGVRIALFAGLWVVYEPLCTSLGCTAGNYIKKIRVRQSDDTGKRINILQALVRYILKIALGWVSFLTIHSNKERRAIHDPGAGSVMIKI